jgi:DNA primase catalytic subunit
MSERVLWQIEKVKEDYENLKDLNPMWFESVGNFMFDNNEYNYRFLQPKVVKRFKVPNTFSGWTSFNKKTIREIIYDLERGLIQTKNPERRKVKEQIIKTLKTL